MFNFYVVIRSGSFCGMHSSRTRSIEWPQYLSVGCWEYVPQGDELGQTQRDQSRECVLADKGIQHWRLNFWLLAKIKVMLAMLEFTNTAVLVPDEKLDHLGFAYFLILRKLLSFVSGSSAAIYH